MIGCVSETEKTRLDPKTLGCRVRDASSQSISDSTVTPVDFDTEDFDTDAMHDTVTNNSRITVNTAGVYAVGAHMRWATNATGNRRVQIRLNGGANLLVIDIRAAVSGTNTDQGVTTIYDFAEDDYIEVEVAQDSGGPLNILGGDTAFAFWAVRQGQRA